MAFLHSFLYFFLWFCTFETIQSLINLDNVNDNIVIQNFHESADGKFFSKQGTLLLTETTKSKKECCFRCVQNENCLSVNVITVDQTSLRCELLSWAGTGFGKYLVPKISSKFMQMKTACSPNPCQNGGECTAKDKRTNYTCACPYYNIVGRNCELIKCVLFDFETGKLDGWTLTGTAFKDQPTYGDNSLYRQRISSNLKGNWSISTYEYRPSPSFPPGEFQGDQHIGTATSPPFRIRGKKLKFLIGGGNSINNIKLELLVKNGSVVAKATNAVKCVCMKQNEFDVTKFKGEELQVRMVDESTAPYGFICLDHIEDSFCTD